MSAPFIFARVILYLVVGVMGLSLGAYMHRAKCAIWGLSVVFFVLSLNALLKGVGQNEVAQYLFDYAMTAYLVILVGLLAKYIWKLSR